ncbi:MAG: PIN domain-containing protein [Bryobacterales bacterium]|nr:PIN domain-containing protein [Bryobacterales bacterium]
MNARGRFSLDTNILVYTVDLDSGDRHEQSKELFARAAKNDCVLTVQALAEFFHVTTRKGLLPVPQARAFVHAWLEVFEIASADEQALANAMDAVEEHRFSFWDAMMWATVRRVGCSAVVSEDMQDGRILGGVEFINPFADHASTRLATFLRA